MESRIIHANHMKTASILFSLIAIALLSFITFSSAAIEVVVNNSDVTINTTYRGEISLKRLGGYPMIVPLLDEDAYANDSEDTTPDLPVYSWTRDFCSVPDEWVSASEDSNLTCTFVTYASRLKSGRYSYTIGVEDWAGNERYDEKNFTVELPFAPLDENCYNDVTDGTETDLNCGGSGCLCCDLLKKCLVDNDCCDAYCRQGFCAEPRCDDLIRNGFESDVDCGGTCPACGEGKNCTIDSDCITGFCNSQGICAYPRCDDGSKNGFESDVDCGGANCSACSNGMSCEKDSDCESDYCEAGFCACDKSIDTDGDRMDDCWEIKYGLDPYDPDDAGEDLDDDGVSNLDEYLDRTDPTDPTDPGREKSHLLGILLLIFGLLLMSGSTGFLIYSRKVLLPKERLSRQRQQPAGMLPGQQRPGASQIGASQRPSGAIQQQQGGKSSIAQALAQRRLARQQGRGGAGGAGVSGGLGATKIKTGEASAASGISDDSEGYISLSDLNKKNKGKSDDKDKSKANPSDGSIDGSNEKPGASGPGKQVKLSSAFDKLKELTSKKKLDGAKEEKK